MRMANYDSLDDDVFEEDSKLQIGDKKANTPSPTGYRDYKPPAEILRMCQTDILEDNEQLVHKVAKKTWRAHT